MSSIKSLQPHLPAGLILLAFLGLAVVYSLVTPPFEAGDESRHYAVVKYMADTGRLPVQAAGEAQVHWSHEGNQPPLYYALAAGLTFWIETGSWDEVYWYNPHTSIGNPLRPDNKNITIHPPAEAWPWRGYVLAVHLIRFLSIVMAGVTVVAGYAIALRLFRGRRWPAAGAMAITAFNPMFIFISASVNNDNLVVTLVSLALWLMVVAAEAAFSETGHGGRVKGGVTAALLGLLIGLGALSKLYALGLLPLAGLLLVGMGVRGRGPGAGDQGPGAGGRGSGMGEERGSLGQGLRRAVGWNLVMVLVVLAVAGWFYGRNALLYDGDVLALQVMRDTAGKRAEAPSWSTIRAEFEGFRIAYWALFGGVNILADAWIYRLLDAVSLLAALGVFAFIVALGMGVGGQGSGVGGRGPGVRGQGLGTTAPGPEVGKGESVTFYVLRFTFLPTFLLLLGWYGIMLAGFIGWNLTQPAGQGRLLYPAITAISALGLLGLTWWLPKGVLRPVVGLCIAGLLAFAAVVPFRYIAPAYRLPPRLAEADLPAGMVRVNFIYDDTLRLIGYHLPVSTVRPAETVPLTLYWQLIKPARLDYSIFVHLLGRGRQPAGQIDTYPGGGLWPATLLSPGDILADSYRVPVQPETEFAQAPTRLLIAAGIYDIDEPGRPGRPVVDLSGRPVEPVIASLRLVPWQWPQVPVLAAPVEFADSAGPGRAMLLSYDLALDRGELTLNWQAGSTFNADYTVFIQLWRASATGPGEYVTGFDGPPRQGDYPTSLWQPGDIVVDPHRLDLAGLPAGNYFLLVGLYQPASGQRLPAYQAGAPLPDYALPLDGFRLEAQPQ